MQDYTGFFGSFIWWIFIFYLVLGPQLQHRSLQIARQKLLKKLGEKRGSNVITIIHRQESIGLFGIPFYRFIDIDDSEQVLRAIRATPEDKPIDLIINTPGGLVLAASQIARAIREHRAKTTVIVPHYAMSGGTLIALAADEILMDSNAVLGPIDPQLKEFPAPSVLKAVEKKGGDKVKDETLIMADIAEKSIQQIQDFVFGLLKERYGENKARELANVLTEGRWTHDFPITVDVARELGLNVNTSVPEEVYSLMELYPQPITKRHPSVEFIPTPSKQKR